MNLLRMIQKAMAITIYLARKDVKPSERKSLNKELKNLESKIKDNK